MENEQMNQEQPTYDQVVQAYNMLMSENQQLVSELNFVKQDKAIEKIKTLTDLILKLRGSDTSYDSIIDNAKWHLEQMLAKPDSK